MPLALACLIGCRQYYCGFKIISYPTLHLKLITVQRQKRKLAPNVQYDSLFHDLGKCYESQTFLRLLCFHNIKPPLLHGEADYMTNKEKLKELRKPDWAEAVLELSSCFAQASSPAAERPEAHKQPLWLCAGIRGKNVCNVVVVPTTLTQSRLSRVNVLQLSSNALITGKT